MNIKQTEENDVYYISTLIKLVATTTRPLGIYNMAITLQDMFECEEIMKLDDRMIYNAYMGKE